MTKLILVRHGESETNRSDCFSGHIDIALLDMGIQQAQRTGSYIAKTYSVDKVYASDLLRARQTGTIIAEILNLDCSTHKGLREINAGLWEGRKYAELEVEFSQDYSVWLNDIGNCVCTGGESVRQLSERVLAALSEIAEDNDGKTVVVVSHATPIRCVQCILSGNSLDSMKRTPWVSNASITELEYDGANWKLARVGYDEHLKDIRTCLPENV